MKEQKKRWRVTQWVAHTIPGFSSPLQKWEQSYRFLWWAKFEAALFGLNYETSDGRGVYYTTITDVSEAA